MYHVAPSASMITAAKSTAGTLPPQATIELWHGSLERYGGSQLNDRFRARFKRPMTSDAWAGWVAVKIGWETSLRAQSVDSKRLFAVLDNEATQFDGHKGVPLSFRSWDHQLRQPLYAVDGENVVAELPNVGRNADQSMREQLDHFGDPPGRCVIEAMRRDNG
jgi:ABC transporter substrate binding protein (PQQ-dependent alcohol dehydrogenase system)